MQLTPNLTLKKPGGTDVADIADLNENADILDAEVVRLASTIAPGRMSATDKVKLDEATSAATPSKLVQRDASGRFKAAAPVAADDVARKAEVDAALNSASNAVQKTVTLSSGIDLNTVITSGFYCIQNSYTSGPAGYEFGQMIVSRGGDTIVQFITGFTGHHMHMRQGNPPAIGGGGTWQPWVQIMTAAGGTFSGAVTAQAGVYLPNNTGLIGNDTVGEARQLVFIGGDNATAYGDPRNLTRIRSHGTPRYWDGTGDYEFVTTKGGSNIYGAVQFREQVDFFNKPIVVHGNSGSRIGYGGEHARFECRAPTADSDAFMTFHVAGKHAFHFGLSKEWGDLRVGGYSDPGASYRVWDERFLRYNPSSKSIEIHYNGAWYTVGGGGMKSVQRGTAVVNPNGGGSATINAVNVSKSFVNLTTLYTESYETGGSATIHATLANPTTVTFSPSQYGINVSFEVVEFN